MKKFLNFPNFSKIFKKRAFGTQNTPKPANEIFEKIENFNFFPKIPFVGLGCVLGPKALFFKIFGKFKKF